MTKNLSIVWFRQDLRLSDNLAIAKASNLGDIMPIYILDDPEPDLFKIGSASKIWLHESINKLNESLDDKLNLYIGKSSEIIAELCNRYNIQNIFWNICYEPWHLKQEYDVKVICKEKSINYESFNSNYLWYPSDILKDDDSYYKVFTAYKNKSYLLQRRNTIKNSKIISFNKDLHNKTVLSDLNLIDHKSKWSQKILKYCNAGELEAQKKLDNFIENGISGYKNGRDYPAARQTSLLSSHLHFGEISPTQIWESVENFAHLRADHKDIEHFLSEVIWREFSCYLMYHFKNLYQDNFVPSFNHFPWQDNFVYLKAWQTGNTGYPLIDAGMRQLWQTGYMHNRVRMVVASFLVKNLNIHWHHGRDWFWDCLIDADLANNSASWQWVAGSGADAAPYFRIFNPTTQGEKFDANGDYTKQFIPELQNLPDKYLFKPWDAPENILKSANVVLGKTYPKPIVDLADSRNKALEAYKQIK